MAQVTCPYCRVIFESSRANQRRCSSPDCKRAYDREAVARHRARTAVQPPPKPCLECGKTFDVDAHRANQRYCSYECGRAGHLRSRRDREYKPEPRACDFCAGQIPYKSGKRRYCSTECQKAGIAREARWRIKGLPPGIVVSEVCELCGAADRKLRIDHDHACCPGSNACGECFRGMLCHPCNVALGMFHESPDELRRAIAYIEAARLRIAASAPVGASR